MPHTHCPQQTAHKLDRIAAVRMPARLFETIEARAVERGLTASEMMRRALAAGIEKAA